VAAHDSADTGLSTEDFTDQTATDVTVHESALIVKGKIWDLRRDRFTFGVGPGAPTLVRDYVDHTGGVAVLALDTDDRVLMFQQYRHPIATRDWEIPAGLMDVSGESGLAAAKRELAEEADLQAARWDLLLDVCLSPGGSSETMRIFLARDLCPVSHDFVRDGEEAEIVPTWVALDDAVQAVLERRLQNSLTTNAVLAAALARDRGWATLGDANEPWRRRATVRGERS
jgi:8-oxo-dGTP pyrophosphatase MutT (NUDIX family)